MSVNLDVGLVAYQQALLCYMYLYSWYGAEYLIDNYSLVCLHGTNLIYRYGAQYWFESNN